MSEKEKQNADKSVFMDLVQRAYSPTSEGLQNPGDAVMYKTSRELQYTFRESCEPTVAEISKAMMDMKFQGVPKEGAFYWMLYLKEPPKD